MKILIVGGGGREHALAWKAAQSQSVDRVYVAPGNAGTAQEPGIENIAIDSEDIPGLLDFATQHNIDLCIPGPEASLVRGIVDEFRAQGLPIFGPTKSAARLEGSKAFSKDFLYRHHIPTGSYATFDSEEKAIAYVKSKGAPIVVKADGLAAGKGVMLAQNEEQAIASIKSMLTDKAFGEAGKHVVIEDYLRGEEASFICMVDGEHVLPMATSQDHKARDNGDTGPNTGGMGAYSPAPVITKAINARIMSEVIEPTVQGMKEEGHPYVGFLYAGLMIEADGTPKVLEFNCRLGDPETQPILMRLRSDIVSLCLAALQRELGSVSVEWDARAALGVVMASGGYPGNYEKGREIRGLDQSTSEHSKVFHAGTVIRENQTIVNSGGRVLCVTSLGETVSVAQERAYAQVNKIHWADAYYRTDIGYQAVARERVVRP